MGSASVLWLASRTRSFGVGMSPVDGSKRAQITFDGGRAGSLEHAPAAITRTAKSDRRTRTSGKAAGFLASG